MLPALVADHDARLAEAPARTGDRHPPLDAEPGRPREVP